MKFGRLRTIMVFVDDPTAAAAFWSRQLGIPPDQEHPLVDLGHVELFFHPADEDRNPQGGTVPYFEIDDLDQITEQLLAAGCLRHRGPLDIGDGQRIVQIRDPFGTVWGLHEP